MKLTFELLRDRSYFRRWALVALALTAIWWQVPPRALAIEAAREESHPSIQEPDKKPGTADSSGPEINLVKQSEEDLVEGFRVRSADGRTFTGPHRALRDYPAVQDLRRGRQSFSRSMRSIDDSVRRMRTSIDRIRTYRRLFR